MNRRDSILIIFAFLFFIAGFGIYKFTKPEIKIGRDNFLGQIGGDVAGVATDNYPWINTILYENLKEPGTYSQTEALFVASHFDVAVAHLQQINRLVKDTNSGIKIIPFTGLASVTRAEQQNLPEFFGLNLQYTLRDKESIYLHYKCDTFVHFETVKGCNLKNPETGECFGTPAPGCSASSATNLSQSRMPDPDANYHSAGWLLPHYLSQVYKDYGVWRLKKILNYYVMPPNNGAYPADGLWWDNILYLGSVGIDKTIEYWGKSDLPGVEHERNRDYNSYFLEVKQRVEQDPGVNRSLIWYGNANSMYWIREGGPYTAWVLSNLKNFSPESWVSPRGAGEYAMPSWLVDCPDLKEVWNYTAQYGKQVAVLTYNHFDIFGADLKTRIFSLSKYYLVKNDNLFFGYSENSTGNDIINTEWNKMAEVNIGLPRINPPGVVDFGGQSGTNKFFDWKNPSQAVSCTYSGRSEVLAARHFTNGLVLARWKANRWDGPGGAPGGAEYNSDADQHSYSLVNPYGPSYYVIQTDGKLSSAPVSEIFLRTNEAVLLLNVCSEGEVPPGSVCGCEGQILNGGSCGEEPPPPPPPSNYTPPPSNYILSVSKIGNGGGLISSEPAGINCGSDCSEFYGAGSQVLLSASPESGSKFDGWIGACSGTGNCVLTMDNTKEASAVFNSVGTPPASNYTLRVLKTGDGAGIVTSNPSGIDCRSDCSRVYTNGFQMSLSAVSDENSIFRGWGGGCGGSGICSLVINQNLLVTAQFDPVSVQASVPPPTNQLEETRKQQIIDVNGINETVSRVGKSLKNILYVLNGIAILVLVIALFY